MWQIAVLPQKGRIVCLVCARAPQIHIALTEEGERLKYEVYTALDEGGAVGITDGPVEADDAQSDYKAEREEKFPLSLGKAALTTKLEQAQASQKADRDRILNTIAGQSDLKQPALPTHPNYDTLNHTLRGRFAASLLYQLLKADEPVADALECLKRSGMRKLPLYLRDCLKDATQAEQVFGSLPESLQSLDVASSHLGPIMGGVLAAALPQYGRLATLRCAHVPGACCSAPLNT